MNEAKWQLIKSSYVSGQGSMRALAARYGVSESGLMKRARREHWHADRMLAARTADAAIITTMQQRAEDFVHRSAEQTDTFMNRIQESEKILEPEDRKGLRLLASTLKDVVSVGRDTFNLGSRDDGNHCLVSLSFLQNYNPEDSLVAVALPQPPAN